MYNGKPATVEEYVPGSFYKLINPTDDSSPHQQELFSKAECLVHYSYVSTKEKMVILDIQGSGFTLYDPEISTAKLIDGDTEEWFFVVVETVHLLE